MKIVTPIDKISLKELTIMSEKMFNSLVKAVVDIEQEIMVVDSGLHSDEELLLLEQGSSQGHLWGINLYPQKFDKEDFIEFDSMINIRPGDENASRGVDNPHIRKKIKIIVNKLVIP
jgi:hypothetical protein